jgi:hypothetical protein
MTFCSVVTGSTPLLAASCPGSGLIFGFGSGDVQGRPIAVDVPIDVGQALLIRGG